MLAHKPATRQLEIIQYRKDQRAFEFRTIDFQEDGSPAVFSEKNPVLCLTCHRKDPRPNWEHYSIWPGAYGEEDDRLISREEREGIQHLVAIQKTHPRLAPLINLEESYRVPSGDYNRERTQFMHNSQFNGRIARWNFHRVARIMQATPHYDKYKYAIVGLIQC